ncbi:MAG: hypothetical protein ACREP9_16640, partial [Candidatus Dormibacteraceae bacterium]
MQNLNSPRGNLIPAAILAALVLPLACQSAHAGTPDFSRAVQGIETHYQIHRNYRFLMGFASFVASVWRPGGVKHMKIALFENPRVLDRSNSEEFMKVVHASLDSDWQIFIRDYSPKDGERTWIFARVPSSPHPHRVTLLIATMDQDDAVIIQASMDARHWSDDVERVNSKTGSKTSYSRSFL